MNKYKLSQIGKILHAKLIGKGKDTIRTIFIDSRKSYPVKGSLFFAIKGIRHDGHCFVPDLYKKGVRNFVVEAKPKNIKNMPDANFLVVENSLSALQQMGIWHRNRFRNIPVVGITGSNGKTIVKEWLFELLRKDKIVTRSPKSYNSQVGVPLSVWQMNADTELAIFEAGISQTDEMANLQKIINPTIGIFTNIGDAHQENFCSIKQKIREKLRLFLHCNTLLYCKDCAEIHEQIESTFKASDIHLVSWSRNKNATVNVYKIDKKTDSSSIFVRFNEKNIRINIPFIDNASIENCIHIITLLLYLGYDESVLLERFMKLRTLNMRLEKKEGINNCVVINDAYNSDFGSLKMAADFLNQQKHLKKTLILSDMLECNKNKHTLYRELAELLKNLNFSRYIFIGNEISEHKQLFNKDSLFYPNVSSFLSEISALNFRDEAILIKGARRFRFERISKLLQKKQHETVLEISLDAIVHNLNYYRSLLHAQSQIMCMVKAFGYGNGAAEIAEELQYQKVDYLGVAFIDEGIELRKAGIHLPIMVMNPSIESFEQMLKYKLEPNIFCLSLLNAFVEKLSNKNMRDFCVHIELETGMNRLGFGEHELDILATIIRKSPEIKIKSVFSHLAASDETQHDAFTREQIDKFERFSDFLINKTKTKALRHILNSAGIERFPDAQFDMVRLGIGLYGFSSYRLSKLQHVGTLKSKISQIKKLDKQNTVGYGRRGILFKDTTLATVAIGYADGLNRKLSNRKGKVLINNKICDIVGNICMDMCMVDISDVEASEGDDVVIFGEGLPIYKVAESLGTIPYEIMTAISRRVKNIYVQE